MSFFPTDQDIARVQQALETRIAAGEGLKEELQALVRSECREVGGAVEQLRAELESLRASIGGRLVDAEGKVAAMDARFDVLASDLAKRWPAAQTELERLAQRIAALRGELGAATQRGDEQAVRIAARLAPAEERVGALEGVAGQLRDAQVAADQRLTAAGESVNQRLLELAQGSSAEVGTLACAVEGQQGQLAQLEAELARSRRRVTLLAVVNAVLALAALGVAVRFL